MLLYYFFPPSFCNEIDKYLSEEVTMYYFIITNMNINQTYYEFVEKV